MVRCIMTDQRYLEHIVPWLDAAAAGCGHAESVTLERDFDCMMLHGIYAWLVKSDEFEEGQKDDNTQ